MGSLKNLSGNLRTALGGLKTFPGSLRIVSGGRETFRKKLQTIEIEAKMYKFMKIVENGTIWHDSG